MDDQGLLILNTPISLAECVPVNITWTGGTPPYSLQVTLGNSSDSETIRQFHDIVNTNFLWDTDVPAGTLVSFDIVGERPILELVPEPITVGAGPPNVACVHDIVSPPPTSLPISATSTLKSFTFTQLLTPLPLSVSAMSPLLPNGATSTPRRVTTVTVIVQIPPPSTTPSLWYADQQSAQKVPPVNGVSAAFIVVGLVAFLLLSVWLWWRYQENRRRKDGGDDTERQEVVGRGDNSSHAATLWSDDESPGASDDEATGTPDPFEEAQSALSMDQVLISTTTPPVPDPEPHQTRTDYPPNTSSSFRPRRTKVAQRQRLSSAWQSDTGTISDTGAARLSSSTASSTLPPSYRTRRSSVYYMPAPSYPPPPFPPPAYTPPNSNPPPSAFRTVPRRARGRRQVPPARKLLQSRDDTATSSGLESDGTRSESTRGENSVEGSGMEERLVASAFSDSKNNGSLHNSRQDDFPDTAVDSDNVSEPTGGATIRPTGRED